MFENLQGINPMGHSVSLDNYFKTILHQYENVTNILKIKHLKRIKG